MKRLVILAGAVAALMIGGQVSAADGKAVYDKSCAGCHKGMKPRMGDKAAWAPRLKTGMEALYASALKGKGGMPIKGGNMALADADIKAAVDYLAGAGK